MSRYLYDPDGFVVAAIVGYGPDGEPLIEELNRSSYTLDEIRSACDLTPPSEADGDYDRGAYERRDRAGDVPG